MITIGTATIPDPLTPSYEQLSVEVGRLRAELAAKDALIEEARNLINAAFGEYACAASKYIPENEKALFERNFAVSARNFLAKLKEQE